MTTNTVLFRALLALVVLAPLPLGSYRPWAWSVLGVAVGGLLVAWSVLVMLDRTPATVPMRRLWMVALPFAIALAWAVVQALPGVPGGWVHPLWSEAAGALQGASGAGPVRGTVSLDPTLTWVAVLRLATYGGVFWLAAQLGRERLRAREALIVLAVAGVAYASYGLAEHLSGGERLLWLPKWAYLGDLTVTFVNRNAYGAYAGLGLLCCVALFAHRMRGQEGRGRSAYDLAETVLLRAMPYLLGALVIGSALLLSHSRGAFLATGLGVLVLLTGLMTARVLRPRVALSVAAAVTMTAVAVVVLSGDGTIARMTLITAESDGRENLYRLALQAIGDAPWSGFGLGSFPAAFHVYRDISMASPVVFNHAHNVHLELAMDLGLIGAVALYLSLAAILVTCGLGLGRRRRDQVHPAMALAAAALLAAHGLVDFSAQVPAIGVTLALLLGIGYSQSWSTAEQSRRRSPAPV